MRQTILKMNNQLSWKERSSLQSLIADIRQETKHYSPSKRASETSSRVTFSALNKMAMFCDFFGSNTLFSCTTGGRTDLLVGSFGTEFVELQPKRLSIMSSFNLPKKGDKRRMNQMINFYIG